MAPHSSTVAQKIPWIEEPGGLQSMGLLRVDTTERLHFPFHALEKEMATHSSVLAWRIPWTEKPRRLQSMGSHRVGHDWSDLAAAVCMKWYHVVVLTCVSLVTNDTEHGFTCLLATCISSLQKCLLKSSACFSECMHVYTHVLVNT